MLLILLLIRLQSFNVFVIGNMLFGLIESYSFNIKGSRLFKLSVRNVIILSIRVGLFEFAI